MSTSPMLRRLAASTAVAMAFSPLANAAGYAHPLLDPSTGATAYGARLALTLVNTTKDDAAGLRAKGFVVQLEDALKEPSEKIRIVDYPPRANADLLRVLAVVPPKGFEALPIPVCAEQHNKVVGTWNITAKGEVNTAPWSGPRESERPTSSACKAFIFAARDEINQKLAQAQPGGTPAQPPPAIVSETNTKTAAVVAANNPPPALR